MKEEKKIELLSDIETKQVSGGIGLLGGTKITGTVANGVRKLLGDVGPDGLFRPSPKPKSGNLCCCNCRTM